MAAHEETKDCKIWKRLENIRSNPGENRSWYTLMLILLTVPFYLNDFSNIYVKDWRLWLFIDYTAVKLYPCLLMIWAIVSGRMTPREFGLTRQSPGMFFVVFLVATLVGTLIDQNGSPFLKRMPGYPPLGSMPEIESFFWNWFDLTAGLLMVGLCEECIFRGFMRTYLTLYTRNHIVIILISAIVFGLIHWSGGFHAILITSLIGAVFMTLYLRTDSLPALIIAHFAINFIDYTGVIPKEIFKIL